MKNIGLLFAFTCFSLIGLNWAHAVTEIILSPGSKPFVVSDYSIRCESSAKKNCVVESPSGDGAPYAEHYVKLNGKIVGKYVQSSWSSPFQWNKAHNAVIDICRNLEERGKCNCDY